MTLEQIKAGARAAANSAVKAGGELLTRSKQQMSLLTLDSKLAKAQRQLGALVYALRKNEEQNEALVQRYVDTISEIETQMAQVRAAQEHAASNPAAAATVLCPGCGAEVDQDAIFCPGCGCKL